jgi:hypothetical protein
MSFSPSASFDSLPNDQVKIVGSLEELVSTRWAGKVNALCWPRRLDGDFREIAAALPTDEPILTLDEAILRGLTISPAGRLAAEAMLSDLRVLQERDLLPELNCIQSYPREDQPGVVPLDVYSFHADSANVETDTYLCTYFGAATEAVRNDEAFRYVDRPEIRAALLAEFGGAEGEAFQAYLRETGYDLHYGTRDGARPFSFGIGNLWRIATESPESPVPPCIHRAPTTMAGELPRVLLIS